VWGAKTPGRRVQQDDLQAEPEFGTPQGEDPANEGSAGRAVGLRRHAQGAAGNDGEQRERDHDDDGDQHGGLAIELVDPLVVVEDCVQSPEQHGRERSCRGGVPGDQGSNGERGG